MKRYVLALVATVVVLAAGAGSAAASGGPGGSQDTSSGTSVLQGGSSASADGGTNALFVDQGNANEGDVTATGGDADASVDQENEVEDVTQNADGGVALNAVNPNVAVVLGGDGGEVQQGGSSASADGGTNVLVVDQQNGNEGDVTATGGDGGGAADASLEQENEVENVEQNADGGVAINALNPNVAVVLGGGDGAPADPCEKSRCDGSSGTEVDQGGSSASADGGTNELFVEQENANEGDVTATGGDGAGSAHPCKAQRKGSCNSGGGGGGDADASVEQENEVEDVTQNANGGWAINVLNPNVALVVPHDAGQKGCKKDVSRCGGRHASGTRIHQGGSSASADGGTNVLVAEQENANKGDVTATGGDGAGSAHPCKAQRKGSCNSGGGGGGDADASVEQENEVEDVTQNANGGWAINVLNPNIALLFGPDHRPGPSMSKH